MRMSLLQQKVLPPGRPPHPPGRYQRSLRSEFTGENSDTVGSRINKAFSSSNSARNIAVINRHFTLAPVSRDIQDMPALLLIISAFVVIIALPLIALISAMVAHERQREIGLLKSMGAKRKIIFFLVITESLVLAAIGGIAGVGASMFAFFLMNDQGILNSALQVSFRMPPLPDIVQMASLALLVVIAIGSISSLWRRTRAAG